MLKVVALLLVCIGAAKVQGYCGTVQADTRKIGSNVGGGVSVSGMTECGDLCDATSNCAGATFTPAYMECWMHTDVSGAFTQSGHSLYTKCPPEPECGTVQEDTRKIGDNVGGGVSVTGMPACITLCDNTANCAGATFTPAFMECWMHTDVSGAIGQSGHSLYTKCPPEPEYCGTVQEDTRKIGSNVGGGVVVSGMPECSDLCDSTSNCAGATFTPAFMECWMHTDVSGAISQTGHSLYTKIEC